MKLKIQCMSFYDFIVIAQAMYFFCISARGHKHKCAISYFTTVHSNTVFHSVNESVFKRIVWYEWFSKSFIKTGTCCHLLVVYCHIYLSMTDLNQPRCQHKNTFSQILFIYQYWPKFLYFRPRRKKACANHNSFNKDNFLLNRNLF